MGNFHGRSDSADIGNANTRNVAGFGRYPLGPRVELAVGVLGTQYVDLKVFDKPGLRLVRVFVHRLFKPVVAKLLDSLAELVRLGP